MVIKLKIAPRYLLFTQRFFFSKSLSYFSLFHVLLLLFEVLKACIDKAEVPALFCLNILDDASGKIPEEYHTDQPGLHQCQADL